MSGDASSLQGSARESSAQPTPPFARGRGWWVDLLLYAALLLVALFGLSEAGPGTARFWVLLILLTGAGAAAVGEVVLRVRGRPAPPRLILNATVLLFFLTGLLSDPPRVSFWLMLVAASLQGALVVWETYRWVKGRGR